MFRSVKTKIIGIFLVAMLVTIVCAAIAAFQYIYWHEHEASDVLGHSAVNSCASFFSVADFEKNNIEPESEEYSEYRESLRRLCVELGMDYLYAFYCDTENNTLTYIMCVADDSANDERVARERGYGIVVPVEYPDQLLRALAGEDVTEAYVLDNEYGNMLAWYKLVEGYNGKVVAGADYSISEQRIRIFRTTFAIVVPFILIFIFLLFVQLAVMRVNVFDPLHVISSRMKTFSDDQAGQFKPLGIKSNDEMEDIADAFEKMASDIDEYTNDIRRMTAERVQVDVELDVARRIQLGMVPEHNELSGRGFEVCARSRPAREVGGDFFDIMQLDNGCVAVVIGDASGKGVAAALFMSMAMTMIRDGLTSGKDPADVLNHANRNLCESNPEGMFITVFACVFNPETGELRYANAGQTPPLLVGEGVDRFGADPGILLGLFDDAAIQGSTIRLELNQALLLYSDGAVEAVNEEKSFLGEHALIEYLAAHAPFASVHEIVDAVVHRVDEFAAGHEQFDDLTVVALMRHRVGKTKLACKISSFLTVRTAILAISSSEKLARKACLACEEAFTNIALYSGANAIWFEVCEDDNSLHVVLEDDGVAFDPTAIEPAEKNFEELENGGMGIGIVRELTSSLEYRWEHDHNILELTVSGSADESEEEGS